MYIFYKMHCLSKYNMVKLCYYNIMEDTIMKTIKKVLVLCMCVCLSISSTISFAHSGRTDANGGHHDYQNKSGLGSYHYHHGLGPHLHKNGVCPYSTKAKSSSSSRKTSKYYNTSTVKKVQKKLKKLGYKCGAADGHCGSKTKAAIKKYQRKKHMAVNGKITKTLLKKLKIS